MLKDINSSTPDVVVQLGRMMRDRNFENGNYNIRKGEMGVEMFFVLHGCAEWCYGEYFGEAALSNRHERTTGVQSMTSSELTLSVMHYPHNGMRCPRGRKSCPHSRPSCLHSRTRSPQG